MEEEPLRGAPDDERGDDQRDVGETERGSSDIGGAPG